ncbi:MAG: ribosome biogenesis GTPase Der [Betaproteobacteria bacterium]|nr:ribosome biogenesis GTPase Der [Betaproteobacteria bacterium]
MSNVAIVGRPNVGKSSLFNKLTKSKKAIVSEFEGLTRDRQVSKTIIDNLSYEIIDSGGLNFSNNNSALDSQILNQTNLATDEADLVLFVVDYKSGLLPDDQVISKLLRKKNKDICLVINKVDGVSDETAKLDFMKLGYQQVICTSVSHNYGIDSIIEFIAHKLDGIPVEPNEINDNFKIAILGKPNAGKSTLINSLIGSDRLIASNLPGTTIDSIEIEFELNSDKYILVDTAGIRRKGKVTSKEEKFALLKSLESAKNANFILLIIDSSVGITSQDQALISLNQYEKERFNSDLEQFNLNFGFIDNIKISAEKKTNLSKIFKNIKEIRENLSKEYKTSILNKLLEDALINHPPSISKGIRPKLKFMSFVSKSPLSFKIHGNHLEGLAPSYKKYLDNYFRKALSLQSIPLRMIFEASDNPYAYKAKRVSTGLVTRRKIKNQLRKKLSSKN